MLTGHQKPVTAVAFCPNQPGRLASASLDGTVRVWNLLERKEEQKFTGHRDSAGLRCVAWSRDGGRLATGGNDGEVVVWDARGNKLCVCEGHGQPVTGVAWYPLGDRLLTGGEDGSIRIYKVQ